MEPSDRMAYDYHLNGLYEHRYWLIDHQGTIVKAGVGSDELVKALLKGISSAGSTAGEG